MGFRVKGCGVEGLGLKASRIGLRARFCCGTADAYEKDPEWSFCSEA